MIVNITIKNCIKKKQYCNTVYLNKLAVFHFRCKTIFKITYWWYLKNFCYFFFFNWL